MDLSKITTQFGKDSFSEDLVEKLLLYGVVIIEDVMSPELCTSYVDQIVDCFETMCPGVKRDDATTWLPENLPPQTRPGMYQALVTNLPPLWEIRACPKIKAI